MNKTVNLAHYNKTLDISAGRLKQISWYYINLLFINSYWLPLSSIKIQILKLFGAKIAKGVNIKPKVNIKYPWKLIIGENCWIGEEVWIDNLAVVELGNNVVLSQGSMLLCGNHDYKKSEFDLIALPIKMGDGVWIGAKSIVTPGVICETHAILSVNSVATSNLQAYGIYSGNPAIWKRQRVIE
jgi:putative colanic acid biosynthesis acetyltransferase WcaF